MKKDGGDRMKTVKDFELAGKRVLIRCDFNVPMKDGKIIDDTRMIAALPTIVYCLKKNAKVILLSHLGKVKTESDKKEKSLAPVARRLEELLKKDGFNSLLFVGECTKEEVTKKVNALKEGEVILLENTRFQDIDGKKESGNDLELAAFFASLGDIFINDAFGTMHRAHASNVGITQFLPSGIGFLVEKELTALSSVFDPVQPFILILGGAKVEDKIGVIAKFAPKVSKILIGGGMAFPFLEVEGYETGASLKEPSSTSFCKEMLTKYADKIILPLDFATAKELKETEPVIKDITELELDDMGLDIGPHTIELFKHYLKDAKTVLWNGPLGVYEFPSYQRGTTEILSFLAKNHKEIKTVVGGGDTVACAKENHLENTLYHLSTGGGAALTYLENETLVGLEAVEKANESK